MSLTGANHKIGGTPSHRERDSSSSSASCALLAKVVIDFALRTY